MAPPRNIAIMMIFAAYFALIHACNLRQIIKQEKQKCLVEIGNYFNLPIPHEILSLTKMYGIDDHIDKIVDEFLDPIACAKNAIIYLTDKGIEHENSTGRRYDGYGYYLYFKSFLKPKEGLLTPRQFCTQHYKNNFYSEENSDGSLEELYVLQIDRFRSEQKQKAFEDRCMEYLSEFPNTYKEILEDAFYKFDKIYIAKDFYKHLYLHHIHDNIDLNPMHSPTQYCYNKVIESLDVPTKSSV